MTGETPPERPLKDRCEDLIDEWREKKDGMAYQENMVQGAYCLAHGDCAEELEALLDGGEP